MIDKPITDLNCVTGYLAVALLAISIAILAYGILSSALFSLEVAIPGIVLSIAGVLLVLIAKGNIVLDWWPLGLGGGTA